MTFMYIVTMLIVMLSAIALRGVDAECRHVNCYAEYCHAEGRLCRMSHCLLLCRASLCSYSVSFMQNVATFIIMQSVIMLSVIMPSVVAPAKEECQHDPSLNTCLISFRDGVGANSYKIWFRDISSTCHFV